MEADIVYASLRKYVQETLNGGGAVAGKNVIISDIAPIDGGNRITFSYTLDDGTEKTSTLDVMDGKGGTTYVPKIGTVRTVSPDENASVSVTADEEAKTATYTFEIPQGEKGQDGAAYIPEIGTVRSVPNKEEAKVSIDIDNQNLSAIFNFQIPIGETGEKGNDGNSIEEISSNENNDIIVRLSDGSEKNIGKLRVDVQADFLTSEGFGNLRYYNGHLQYWDTATEKWTGTSITPENTYIVNVMPKPMQSVRLFYDKRINRYKIRWKEPTDTIVDGQAMCIIEKIVIRRKLNSQVSDENDGELVTTINRRDFGKYEDVWFIDEGLAPKEGEVWHYKWFPITTVGFTSNSAANERWLEAKQYQLYGFVISQNESNPSSMITYIEDNEEFTPVHMDYANDVFNYGDWTGSAFFMNVNPCMLKYDGTVDYFLDPDNYALREDGALSDIANADYEGNAMVQFPKIWWKIQDNGDNTANIYISDSKVDEDFRCWSHIDAENREIDYCYMPIYNGSNIGGRLRSLSAQTPITATAPATEISLAMANNIDSSVIWHTEVWSDRMLVNLLLLLIGKTTDTQKVFGNGNQSQQSVITGTMDKRGLFWGNNTTANDTNGRVKVFGMENYWGCPARLLAGLYLGSDRTLRAKLTWGREDGSAVDGYNTDGSGYMQVSNVALRNTYGYIKQMQFHRLGLYPVGLGGSATTYYADNMYADTVNTLYTAGYGHLNGYQPNGALTLSQYGSSATGRESRNGASISCKPLARHKEETSDGI